MPDSAENITSANMNQGKVKNQGKQGECVPKCAEKDRICVEGGVCVHLVDVIRRRKYNEIKL